MHPMDVVVAAGLWVSGAQLGAGVTVALQTMRPAQRKKRALLVALGVATSAMWWAHWGVRCLR